MLVRDIYAFAFGRSTDEFNNSHDIFIPHNSCLCNVLSRAESFLFPPLDSLPTDERIVDRKQIWNYL